MANNAGLHGTLASGKTLGGKLNTPSSISASLSPGGNGDDESRRKISGVTLTNNSEITAVLSESPSLSAHLRMPPWSQGSDYEQLNNKPRINGEELVGNKTSEDLKIVYENTTSHWNELRDFVPPKGAIIIYSDHSTYDGRPVPGFKVGDGSAYLIDLPFSDADIRGVMNQHTANTAIHITEDERAAWNAKVRCDAIVVSGSDFNLVFST